MFACEPKHNEFNFIEQLAKEQKYRDGYLLLFQNKNMPRFVDRFFKGALIYDRENSNRCDFYWDPTKKTDIKTLDQNGRYGANHLWMRPYKSAYEINFKKLHEKAITERVKQDSDIAKSAKLKLTLDPDCEGDRILEIAPLDAEDLQDENL